jgi:hypothetical protein
MYPDRKYIERVKNTRPRDYKFLIILFRICGPVITIGALFMMTALLQEFQGKNRYDANSYPLTRLATDEFTVLLFVLVGARVWFLSKKN